MGYKSSSKKYSKDKSFILSFDFEWNTLSRTNSFLYFWNIKDGKKHLVQRIPKRFWKSPHFIKP